MGTYTKIKVIMLYTLNNAEYLAYMNSVLALLPPPSGGEEDRPGELSLDEEVQASGAPDIGLSKEYLPCRDVCQCNGKGRACPGRRCG